MDLTELFGEPIAVYTRAQAIEDGSLVDVSTTARTLGYKLPVALSAGLAEWLSGSNAEIALGVLVQALLVIKAGLRAHPDDERCEIPVTMPWGCEPVIVDIGPGDQAEPVLTMGFAMDF